MSDTKKITELTSGSINDTSQGYIGDNVTGALTRTSYKAMKDYFTAGISASVSGSLYNPGQLNSFSSSMLIFTGSIQTQVNNVYASESKYLPTASYLIDSASFNTRINNVTGSGGTVNTGSLLLTSSFNAYTASVKNELLNLYPTDANSNTAFGSASFAVLTSGANNTAIGFTALTSLQTGGQNTAIGVGALFSDVSGSNNTAIGQAALASVVGSFNTAIGQGALVHLTTGSQNIAIGAGAAVGSGFNASNCIIMGADTADVNANNIGDSCIIIGNGSVTGTQTFGGGNMIFGQFVNSGGGNTVGNNNILFGNAQYLGGGITNSIIFCSAGVSAAIYTGSNLVVLGDNTQNTIIGQSALNLTTSGDKLQVNGTVISTQYKLSALNTAPASVSASGATGEIRFVSGSTTAVYLCVSANHWLRSAMTTF